ncbi:sulfatase-like hydrolase/transferase [Thiobacillus denitrificans]|uniref:sulfatase-like hydrolase/transferase n=1 Tax=Thiobacillus denitrificans TaxID=36861 RepID=UPI0009ECC265|nr:sulfatase-like hydrolase/transferase [Thiobacillus denitrificans]
MTALTILICTHNRADLLERVLASLNAAKRPAMPVQILVAANACTDDTVTRMQAYQAQQDEKGWLPLRLIEVPTPGKSHALNRAIPEIDTELTAFVDDDHRVDENYLVAIEQAAQTWPDAGLYCGRILPDWDGSEPAWVHDNGPYRIYPLPVPRYDQEKQPKTITPEEGPIPGGGNLVVRRNVFELAGEFSTELGPHGHDLGGGEDSEYVLRAMHRGVRCQYTPDMVQHHYVDTERLRLGYLLKKSYQRTRSTSRIHGNGRVPLFMWRKLAEYGFHSLFSLSWARRRFYWIRTAAALGEVHGRRESGYRGRGLALPPDRGMVGIEALALLAAACGLIAWFAAGDARWAGILPAMGVAVVGAAALLAKSLLDFSQTGPRMREEVLTHYRRYTLFALARLTAWAFALMLFTGGAGVLLYFMLNTVLGTTWSAGLVFIAAILGVLGAFSLQFIRKLRFNPGLLVASMHYRMSRLYPLWQWMTPARIAGLQWGAMSLAGLLFAAATWQLAKENRIGDLMALWAATLFFAGTITWTGWQPQARAPRKLPIRAADAPPNILMIGSDTLRADRLGALGYHRALTPNIDALAAAGTLFANCYVPCARTAPSLISMLTGTWPHTHGIRDNFVADEDTRLKVDALPTLLKQVGYRTAALSDWCGGDMGKFSFGFDYTDLPEDQWNLKYLIRQGPKDLRLYLSLFTHNRLGRLMLPELYYLGGVPLTQPLGKRARRLVSRLAESPQPFFLNVFYSTTHPPFASEWPWYTRFADPAYAGESKFAMARLTDPFDIIRRQGAPKAEFDLDQIIDLYDGCVAEFDDEVGKMLTHLETCGLAGNTIVVVYSDHGMEFFEHDTWGQGNSAVGEASPRIPLVIRDPRLPARGRVDDVVRTIDLAPTLLELCGHPATSNMDGVSLVSCIGTDRVCPELDAFNETGIWIADIPGLPDDHLRYPDLLELMEVPNRGSGTLAIKPEYCDTIFAAKDRMIRRGRWKLVYQPLSDGHLLQLFDVVEDPMCKQNQIDQHADIATMLWQRLSVWIGRMPEVASVNDNDDKTIKSCGSSAAALAASNTLNNPQ